MLRRVQAEFADQGELVAQVTTHITQVGCALGRAEVLRSQPAAKGRRTGSRSQALLEHGRLRWDQLLHTVAEQQHKEEAELAQEAEDCFRQMVSAQLLERAPPCDLPPPSEKVYSASAVGH